MTKGQFDHIPMIDVAPLYGDDETAVKQLVEESRTILRDVGFAYIVGHQVPVSLIEAVRSESRTFFASSDEEKKAIAINDWHRGYMAPNSSVIVTSSVAKVSKPNQSESLLILHELPADDPEVLAGKPLQGPNLWPLNQPSLRQVALVLSSAFSSASSSRPHPLGFGRRNGVTFIGVGHQADRIPD